ncbi:TPA: hypothetical protein M4196_002138 [Klebsiella variicola]|nr:hypothetical protein [Klebsiella variicola]HDK6407038.1 hypothetical protein [Klebsiella variicola]
MLHWQQRERRRVKSAKTAPRAIFNKTNGESGMSNSSIMGLALALRNVEAGQAVKVPAMTGQQLRQLLAWLEALR